MQLTRDNLHAIILENLTKSEVSSMIAQKLGDNMDSREFKKKVKQLAADVVSEMFKILWQREGFWKTSASSV